MDEVSCFAPYDFMVGEKICIMAGPRRGDWLVAAVTAEDVTLRCPISHKEFTWKNFCYGVEKKVQQWPQS